MLLLLLMWVLQDLCTSLSVTVTQKDDVNTEIPLEFRMTACGKAGLA